MKRHDVDDVIAVVLLVVMLVGLAVYFYGLSR